MSARRVLLAGEGRHELGGRANDPPYDSAEPPGVLLTLLERCASVPFEVGGVRRWKDIRKFQAGDHASAEERAVLGLHVEAIERGCDVLAFMRDQDGLTDRGVQVARGLEKASELYPEVATIGGVAVQSLDGWILALAEVRGSERIAPAAAKRALADRGQTAPSADVRADRLFPRPGSPCSTPASTCARPHPHRSLARPPRASIAPSSAGSHPRWP